MITGITVVYNTPELVTKAINSVRRFYPGMELVIVNLSDDGYDYNGKWENCCVYDLKKNIGHGEGLHFALQRTSDPYALIFDSDIELQKPCLGDMFDLVCRSQTRIYGVGKVMAVNDQGRNDSKGGIKYLHPYFALLNVKEYFLWPKFRHHGAPCIHAMLDIHKAKSSDRLLIDFPVEDSVYHKGRGTRDLNPKEFLKNWETT